MQRQITDAPYNHVLTNAGVWSHDGEWIVYDVRSDPAGSCFDGTRIERVHAETGEVQVLFESRNGACCGVATCCPTDDLVAFILGPEDPTPDWAYSPCHRRGIVLSADAPTRRWNLDARNLAPPFTPGALRGGSHVHVFSGDGQWLSFTYEDHVLAELERTPDGNTDLNQRNVAVAAPLGPVRVPRSHPRNHDGHWFSAVVTSTVNCPPPGSDQISRAYEDAWVGAAGYLRLDGSRQARALAFLGDAVAPDGSPLTELLIVDLPEDVTRPAALPLQGTPTRRPAPPAGTRQRRLTFTHMRRFPGIHGPRHWPRSSPDGSQVAFLIRDDAGVVQLWTISPNGGEPRQATHGPSGVESAFTWSPDGTQIAYLAADGVCTIEPATGRLRRLAPGQPGEAPFRPEACVFSPDGRRIAVARPVQAAAGLLNQIVLVDADLP